MNAVMALLAASEFSRSMGSSLRVERRSSHGWSNSWVEKEWSGKWRSGGWVEWGCSGGCGSGGGAETGAEAGASETSLVGVKAVEALAFLVACVDLFLLPFLLLLPGIVGRAGELVGEISEASVMVVSVGVGAVRSIVFLWGVWGGWEGVSGARPG
jgi:hypothetical protein